MSHRLTLPGFPHGRPPLPVSASTEPFRVLDRLPQQPAAKQPAAEGTLDGSGNPVSETSGPTSPLAGSVISLRWFSTPVKGAGCVLILR